MTAGLWWDNLAALPVAIAFAVVGIAAAWWAYRPQARALGPAARWALPALRVVAVVALAVAILKPVVATTADEAARGAVVIVVDASRSMNVTDPRTPAERVALARATGALPAGAPPDAIDAIRADLAAHAAVLARRSTARDEARLAAASGRAPRGGEPAADVASSRDRFAAHADAVRGTSPNLASALASLATADDARADDRLAEADAALRAATAARDAAAYAADTDVRAAADGVASRSRVRLATDAVARLAAGLPAGVPAFAYAAGDAVAPLSSGGATTAPAAAGNRSDARAAIDAAVARLGGAPVRAVVLLSDGRQVDPASDAAAGPPAAPVFAINVAAPAPPPDVSVAIGQMPARANVGESVGVRVDVRATGVTGPVDVRLRAATGNGGTDEVRSVQPGADGRASAVFTLKPDAPGVLDVVASAKPAAGEGVPANNEATGRMRVLSNKLKVAAFAGSPAWDFQYVRNALQRAAWADVSDAVVGVEGTTLPMTPEEILRQDVVVLCDVDVAAFTPAQWDAVSELVTARGGGVVVLANDERVLAGYARQPQAANLLPQRAGLRPAWRTWSGERPTLRVLPAPGAEDAAALRLSDAPGANALAQWRGLPAVFRVLPFNGLRPNVRPLLVEAESQSPVMTEARLGAGRAVVVGLNETWRWRMKVGERDQDRFLLQVVRGAADEPYAVTAGNASLDVDAVTARPGRPVTVRARLLDASGNPSAAPSLTLNVKRDAKAASNVALPAVGPGGAGRFGATLTDLKPGRYDVSLATADGSAGPALYFDVAADDGAELADVSADPAFLRRLAETSGGRYATIDELDGVVARLSDAGVGRARFAERPLWDGPYLFGLVVACLATEWAVRKRVGLA